MRVREANMRRLTIAGLIAASTLGAFVPVAAAQNRAPFWPAITGAPVVTEWYSDLPWTQKLGTFRGNEIDQAIVLPYEQLGTKRQKFCTDNKITVQEDCMIETGIVSILSTLRTDTLYDQSDSNSKIKAAAYCKSNSNPASVPCIEVMLALSFFGTPGDNTSQPIPSDNTLQPLPFGKEPQQGPYNANYGGYVITDGTAYAPQLPWYMSHYCDSQFTNGAADVQDPVCYADYFSPFNNGFNPYSPHVAADWPNSGAPFSVWPAAAPPAPNNHCLGGTSPPTTKCTLVMAGFDLSEVPLDPPYQYEKYNGFLLTWFNGALKNFPSNFSLADRQRHFPWSGTPVTWPDFVYPQVKANPFLGQFKSVQTEPPHPAGCDTTLTGPTNTTPPCTNTGTMRADHFLYPRQCTPADLTGMNVANLRNCGLAYEQHPNGFMNQWPQSFWGTLNTAVPGMLVNSYGRTSFLFAGVPGMQLPVPFYQNGSASGLSIYQQVHNASIFSLYLPIANEADVTNAFLGRNYTNINFYHTLLMSNHMESDPWEFAEGIRGRTLWHDEYRTQLMYEAGQRNFKTRTFAAAFDPATAQAPFHNNTCDGCHVRNGSGIPIRPNGLLDPELQAPKGFMTTGAYTPYYPVKDYTFTGQIRPMKLVFFDLQRAAGGTNDSVYSEPLAFFGSPVGVAQAPSAFYYKNKIMNFYGDSFHVTRPGYGYDWYYGQANPRRMVVSTTRFNKELQITYQPWQVNLGKFVTDQRCQLLPVPNSKPPWPTSCTDIGDTAIHLAIDGGLGSPPSVGFMLLNGKRLGNLSAIEAIPNNAIAGVPGAPGFRDQQIAALVALGVPSGVAATIAGEILWNAGTRGGVNGDVKKSCTTMSLDTCYIGRFGWLGDRVSLEDQVANAAFVEMNMTTSAGYKKLYPGGGVMFPLRYDVPNCGPADKTCVESGGNADLSEQDVDRMAAYARWLGNPTRSEFTAALPEVIAGEQIFGQLMCNTCHVISKIDIVPEDTMLTKVFRDRLANHVAPFLSYLGTDLLVHDMGYLSQVGNASGSIRDTNGVVLPAYRDFVQKIRTPPLKGLRFNRFVTESQLNTKNQCNYTRGVPCDPACDFLLHDGRACDAIEAAFLHDGPAINKLGVIDGLNKLTSDQLSQLRAFLYSL
jgi:CxxC motif-containing protein (DUF1111 family)